MNEELPEATIININIPNEYLSNIITIEEYIQENSQENLHDTVQQHPDINTIYIQNAIPCNNIATTLTSNNSNKKIIYYTLTIGFLAFINLCINIITFISKRIFISIIVIPIYAYSSWYTSPDTVNYYSLYNTFLSILIFPKLLSLILIVNILSITWTLLLISFVLDTISIIVLSCYFCKFSQN